MKQFFCFKRILALLSCIMMIHLSGCGYHLRNAGQWPNELSSLQFQADAIPSDVQSALTQFLKSMHVKLNTYSPYRMIITNYVYSQTQPTSTNTSIPSTISFNVSMTISIVSKSGKLCISPFSVSSQFSELVTGSALVPRSVDPDIKERLLENITQTIYSNLTSDDALSQLSLQKCQLTHPPKVIKNDD